MVKKITLPVTEDGNDPADYDEETLAKVNKDIDREAITAAYQKITPRVARHYVDLYRQLAALRGSDGISCRKTKAYFEACLAVLEVSNG